MSAMTVSQSINNAGGCSLVQNLLFGLSKGKPRAVDTC